MQTASGPTKSKTQLKKERRLAAQAAAEAAALAAQADVQASGEWQTVTQKSHQRPMTSTHAAPVEKAAASTAGRSILEQKPRSIKASSNNLHLTGPRSSPNKPFPDDLRIGSTSTEPQTSKPAPLRQASTNKTNVSSKTWAVIPAVQPPSALAANAASLNTADWPALEAA